MPAGPANQGYSLPGITASVSAAATIFRTAAVSASIATDSSSYELSHTSQSVVDKKTLPCCVSCALGAAMETLNPNWPALAPLFHYYVARYDDRGADADGFLFLDKALATLNANGICREDLHHPPYTEPEATTKPSPDAYTDALTRARRRGVRARYAQLSSGLSNVAWIREQLRQDRPVVVGIQLPVSYPDSFLNSTFEWRNPDSSLRSTSGHCVLVTGYNDARQALHIQDNRGVTQFDRGRWWMGYRVADSSILREAYSFIP